ncbi:unnamed protein product [Prorocentrum cordatum]|uniref:NAD(P)-binding domain-containing protein n=1 Tax=Prorocentrum cordatum TaxID=2364126 RepID=A0ABN9V930_9DINO|nr:unnamed protein product [Polarella glacialis]
MARRRRCRAAARAVLALLALVAMPRPAAFLPAASRLGATAAGSVAALERAAGAEVSRRLAAWLPAQLCLLRSAAGASAAVAPAPGAVAVLGASGKTGRLCVEALRAEGSPALALGRAELDVVEASVEQVAEAVRGCQAVIFACSASAKGGNAAQVDEQAAVKAAQACKLAGVPTYVLISSGGVSRPGSLGYLATNWMPGPTWGIMDAKARGEEGVKAAMRGSGTRYVVLRPGGLEDTKYLGPAEMELNQGDAVGGLVSRADVAACAVAAAKSQDAADTTFELYAHSAFSQGPGSTDGFGGATGKTGYERRGESWPELFRGLRKEISKI